MASQKKAPHNNKAYFIENYVTKEYIRKLYWKSEYGQMMRNDDKYSKTIDKKIKEGKESEYKQQANFIWDKNLIDESIKDSFREYRKLDNQTPDDTASQIEGEPHPGMRLNQQNIAGDRKQESLVVESKNDGPRPDDGHHLKKQDGSNIKKEHKVVVNLQPKVEDSVSVESKIKNEPGAKNDIKTGEFPYCSNPACGLEELDRPKAKCCSECGAILITPKPPEDILKKVIPELTNRFIVHRHDEKQKFSFHCSELQDGGAYVAPYNHINEMNYMSLLSKPYIDIKECYISRGSTLGDILAGIISNNITDPICRTAIFLESKNWWNKKLPGETIIECRFAQEVLNINNGFHIQKNNHIGHLEQSAKDTLCTLLTDNYSKEDLLLRKELDNIKMDIFYSSKTETIYTLDDLLRFLDVENKIIKRLNFKEHSKHTKILNINIFILDENIEALLRIATMRKEFSKIDPFEFTIGSYDLLLVLLGITKPI